MTTTIITKNSSTASGVPLAADLTAGELAVNLTDKRLFSKLGSTVFEVGTNPSAIALSGGTGLPIVGGTTGTLSTARGGTGLTSFTANGLVYASSTSALATGSELTFDGTNLGVPRILQSGSGTYGVFNSSGAGNAWASYNYASSEIGEIGQGSGIISGGSNTDFGIRATNNLVFAISYNEGMRLTSTGLGIGTSSPTRRISAVNTSSGGPIIEITGSGGAGNELGFGVDTTGGYFQQLGSKPISFYTGGSERMRLDSAGNLGLGVTPSAWGGGYKAIQVNSTGAYVSNGSNATGIGHNYYYDGTNNKYLTAGAANLFLMINNEHRFYTAPSGTAGAAITFTQAMTLDASGNLGIGTTSPGAKLDVRGTIQSVASGVGLSAISSSTFYYMNVSSTGLDTYTDANASAPMLFKTGGSERARIDSAGNLLVGQTATGFVNSNSFAVETASGFIAINHLASAADGEFFAKFNHYNYGNIGSITQFGNSAVLYNTTSDYRLKTVIGAVSGAGERIDALEPVEYSWKADGSRTRGFLAHKFQEVYAGSVSGTKDAVDAEGKPVYQSMQASSSEVIADLVAELQSVRQRLAALEAA